ncbi:MAG: sensor histidine kinase [Gemmatimonadetes bacterium]|nr:MAG: sensor histidine kinase [Gemmatimonadota bacterium]
MLRLKEDTAVKSPEFSPLLDHRALLVYLGLGAMILALLFMLLTNLLVRELDTENRKISEALTRFLLHLPTTLDENTTRLVSQIVMDDIVKHLTFPYILTDAEGNPQIWVRLTPQQTVEVWVRVRQKEAFQELEGYAALTDSIFWVRNNAVILDHTEEIQHELERAIRKMDSHYPPLPIYLNFELEDIQFRQRKTEDEILLGYLHYGETPVMQKLRWMPIVQTLIFLLFMLSGLIGYRMLKASEQRSIWAGMAKETAHQLGTPITSLMGWLELLTDPDFVDTPELNRQMIVESMRKDIERLDKVASRFGKIGSMPDLAPLDLNEVVQGIVDYYRQRLPQVGRKCVIRVQTQPVPVVYANRELLEWVIENLIKNALDALEKGNSFIDVQTRLDAAHGMVEIIVGDNGKGIPLNLQSSIFLPGFTTKKRGWGLGLTLARRIMEDYHRGKIRLIRSSPGEGSWFSVMLPVARVNDSHLTN